jgi:hypothetical protein
MGFFDWFKRRPRPAAAMPAPTPAVAEPESGWRVGCEGDLLWAIDPQGNRREVAVSQLSGIAIETNDSGPAGMDFWWLFYGPEEDVAFALPLGAHGEGPMVDRIAALPGFRHDAYATAIRSTDIETYVIWQRPFD